MKSKLHSRKQSSSSTSMLRNYELRLIGGRTAMHKSSTCQSSQDAPTDLPDAPATPTAEAAQRQASCGIETGPAPPGVEIPAEHKRLRRMLWSMMGGVPGRWEA